MREESLSALVNPFSRKKEQGLEPRAQKIDIVEAVKDPEVEEAIAYFDATKDLNEFPYHRWKNHVPALNPHQVERVLINILASYPRDDDMNHQIGDYLFCLMQKSFAEKRGNDFILSTDDRWLLGDRLIADREDRSLMRYVIDGDIGTNCILKCKGVHNGHLNSTEIAHSQLKIHYDLEPWSLSQCNDSTIEFYGHIMMPFIEVCNRSTIVLYGNLTPRHFYHFEAENSTFSAAKLATYKTLLDVVPRGNNWVKLIDENGQELRRRMI